MPAPIPGPFDDAFLRDLPYDPAALLFDELCEVDRERSLVRCRMPTHAGLPLTAAQRTHELRHPRHVAGGLIIHATGMLGFVHAYYVLGLRHADGWIGYGTHIHRAVFRRLIRVGEPVEASCQAIRSRIGTRRHFLRYRLEMRLRGALCYEGVQSAVWDRVG